MNGVIPGDVKFFRETLSSRSEVLALRGLRIRISAPADRKSGATYFLEVREKIIPAPPKSSQLSPRIVICCGSTVKEHAVYHGTSTHNSCSWDAERAIVQSRLRNAREIEFIRGCCQVEKARYQNRVFMIINRAILDYEHCGYLPSFMSFCPM